MNARDQQIRALIAEQAGDWFVAHRDAILGAAARQAFDEWLLASPVHVEEYLATARIASALPQAADDPDHPLEAILARVDAADQAMPASPITAAMPRHAPLDGAHRVRLWPFAAVAASLVLTVAAAFLWWRGDFVTPERYATQHGELKTWRLADRSVLRLNTDTAVTVRYGPAERLVELTRGQALFEVAHERARRFRVIAGKAEVIAVGTRFDVYRHDEATTVTVTDGLVTVSTTDAPRALVRVSAGEQLQVTAGALPGHAKPADVVRSTAWLRRQIVFEQEPLAAVAAEFNRYGAVPIEIEAPSLQTLAISGVFAADDPDTFIAFLRTLDGVTVESTPTRVRVLARNVAAPREAPATH